MRSRPCGATESDLVTGELIKIKIRIILATMTRLPRIQSTGLKLKPNGHGQMPEKIGHDPGIQQREN